MEKEPKRIGKIYLGLIMAVISLIGIPLTIIYPLLFNPIQLIFCVILVVGIAILTKRLIENNSERLYWLPFLAAGFLAIISLFTPESYNQLVHTQYSLPDDVSWLWDLKFVSNFQITEVFFLILVLIAAGGILFISIKTFNNFENLLKYSRFLKTFANFLIISSVCLHLGKMAILDLYLFPNFFVITPGFALVGPFFMGVLVKNELRIFRKNLEISQDEFQRKRNKVGYAYTIVGVYILIILRGLIDRIGGAFFTILPADLAHFVLFFNLVVVLIAVFLALASVFWALFDPKWSVALFIITGVIIAIAALVVSWFYVFALFLLSPDIHKTRKIAKAAKNQ